MNEHHVCNTDEIGNGAMRAFDIEGKRIVVFHAQDGTFSALEDRCSHADVRLSGGDYDGNEVQCPAHGARFDAKTGKVLCMPAVTAVKAYAVTIIDKKLFVSL